MFDWIRKNKVNRLDMEYLSLKEYEDNLLKQMVVLEKEIFDYERQVRNLEAVSRSYRDKCKAVPAIQTVIKMNNRARDKTKFALGKILNILIDVHKLQHNYLNSMYLTANKQSTKTFTEERSKLLEDFECSKAFVDAIIKRREPDDSIIKQLTLEIQPFVNDLVRKMNADTVANTIEDFDLRGKWEKQLRMEMQSIEQDPK